jgi:signal peptidase
MAKSNPNPNGLAKIRMVYRWGRRVGGSLLVALVAGYLIIIFALHLQPMTMVTGSMQKTIPVGSLVVDRTVPSSSLKVRDVISFQKTIGAKVIDTHRIIKIQRSNGHVVYRTKGDSNPIADPWAISFDKGQSAHRMVFSLPYLGFLLLFAHSKIGILLLVGYTCLTLIVTFLKMIAQTAKLKAERGYTGEKMAARS